MSDQLADDIMGQIGGAEPPAEPPKKAPDKDVHFGGAANPDDPNTSFSSDEKGDEQKPPDDEKPTTDSEEAVESQEGGPEGEQEPQEDPVRTRDKLMNIFRATAKRFRREFTGEERNKEEETKEEALADNMLTIGGTALGTYLAIVGAKGFTDVPRYISQKIFTSKERSRILGALEEANKELGGEETEVNPVDEKKQALAQAIQESKFLTQEKKDELTQKLEGIVDSYDKDVEGLEELRKKDIEDALKEAIDNRIKNTEVLKQTLNSALSLTGLQLLRVGVYSSVALYERHKTVSTEMAEEKRSGSYLHEMVVGGAKETWAKLKGGGAETVMGRTMNRAQAVGTVLRGAGLAGLAVGEVMNDGVIEAVKESIESFQEHGALTQMQSNFIDNLTPFFGGDADETQSTPEGTNSDSKTPTDGTATPAESTSPTPETATPTEALEAQTLDVAKLESGTVGGDAEHNSILGLITSQLKANAEDFGFSGEGDVDTWANEQALQAARIQGLVRSGGDTRLSTEAIGRLSVVATSTEGGGIDIGFVDISSDTPDVLNMDELVEKGLTYEHGAPADPVAQALEQIPAQAPGATGLESIPLDTGGTVEFEYAGEVVSALGLDNIELTPEEMAQVEAMLGGMETLNAEAAQVAEQAKDVLQDNAEALAAYHKTLEALQETGQLQTAEGMEVIQQAQRQLDVLLNYGIVDSGDESIQELNGFFQQFRPELIINPSLDGLPPIESIQVEGVGEVPFTYDAAGRPSLDIFALTQDPQPSLVEHAQGLLVEGWENTIESSMFERADEFKDSATRILIMEKALRALEETGQTDTGEALMLKQAIAKELTQYGKYFDADNPIIRQAMVDGDTVVAASYFTENIHSSPELEPDVIPETSTMPEPQPEPGLTETPPADTGEPLHKFVGEDNKVRFLYNKDGEVKTARIIGFFANRSEMTEAADEFGVPKDQLYEAFRDKGYDNDWNTQGERVMRQMVYALEQRGVLQNMAEAGLQDTPEYAYLQGRVDFNTNMAESWVQKVFGGYKLPDNLAPTPTPER